MAVLHELPTEAIAALCRKHGVRELSVFGSVLTDDFGESSDIDLLVEFLDGDAGPWMTRFQAFEDDLTVLFGRKIDLISRKSVERNPNWLIRNAILESARVLYES